MNVLIVDDDELALEVLHNAVEDAGHRVTAVGNASQALDALRDGDCHVVISDWMMPGMSGPELCRAIRQRSAGYVYLLLLTSHDSMQSRVEGFAAGADDFISKPFHPAELTSRIRVAERILALESRDVTIFAL